MSQEENRSPVIVEVGNERYVLIEEGDDNEYFISSDGKRKISIAEMNDRLRDDTVPAKVGSEFDF